MAEFVMKDLVEKAGLTAQFHIESAATSREELGNSIYSPARRKLTEHGIACSGHAARQLTKSEGNSTYSSAWTKPTSGICGASAAVTRMVRYICCWTTPTIPAVCPTRGTPEILKPHGGTCCRDVRGYCKSYCWSEVNRRPQNDKIQLFEDKRIRTAWDEEKEEWYFSIADVCEVLSGTDNPRRYWSDLKRELKSEGAVELYEKIVQLKMAAPDGKKRLTDIADTEQLLRSIRSIPSPKAEPFKLWLAQVGRERIEEIIDPEWTIERAPETYLKKGYTREWINQRLQDI